MHRTQPDRQFSSDHLINRELSLLQFQRRVLAQVADPSVPLMERLRFLCIVSSNLDEFFEVRVAGVKEQQRLGSLTLTTDAPNKFSLGAASAYVLAMMIGILRSSLCASCIGA